MPTSDPSGIAPVLQEVMRLRPQTILDVGIGMGKWAMLFREYLEGWGAHRVSPDEFKLTIDGVEIYEPYIQPWHHAIYDAIHIGDVRTLAPELPRYDLVYLGDVIEHMPKPDGAKLLQDLKFKTAIVSTPAMKTRMIRGKPNPFLDHKCVWTAADFGRHAKVLHRDRLLIVRLDK
jgi:2-polyprenyl-3-methyl-5-hydroxy-6-metoxy-1,4-benzoquinol methylase